MRPSWDDWSSFMDDVEDEAAPLPDSITTPASSTGRRSPNPAKRRLAKSMPMSPSQLATSKALTSKVSQPENITKVRKIYWEEEERSCFLVMIEEFCIARREGA